LRRVLLHSIGVLNFDVNLGKAAFGEILMLTWRGKVLLGENADVWHI
jgi:hypothetical protein